MSSVRTSIRETGVKSLLKRIIAGQDAGAAVGTTSGYLFKNTIRDQNIGIPPTSVENMHEFPFVNVFFENEVCANASPPSALQTGGNRQLWHNTLTLVLDWHLLADDQQLAQDDILADTLAAFGNDYTMNNTVFSCAYASSQPFGTELNKPNCGITIQLNVWYRIFQTNPDVAG